MSDRLTGPLFDDPQVAAALSDDSLLRAMLDVEGALALAGAQVGLVPAPAADAVAETCRSLQVRASELGRAGAAAGNPVPALVQALEAAAPEHARPWVHFGATSQDVLDTGLVLIARAAAAHIVEAVEEAADRCARLAADHRDTVMVARTLGQQATPTTFGRRVAGWLAALDEAADTLDRVRRQRLAVSLGGAAGTLAAYGTAGTEVVDALARQLGLPAPDLPWHTDRRRLLDLDHALAGVAVAAGKVAVDTLYMAQPEVGEATLASAGGSSAMPHKANPVLAVLVDAGVRRVPGLVATLLASAVHEQERAAGAWHAEWQPRRELLDVVGGVARNLAALLRDLQPEPARMRFNLDAAGGLVMAESVAARLAPGLGRAGAHETVAAATRDRKRPLREALLADSRVRTQLDEAGVDAALDPASWLGVAGKLTDRAVEGHRGRRRRAGRNRNRDGGIR